MIAFPIVSALISLLCAVTVAREAWRRPRPDKIIWSIAFLLFVIAAGADAYGRSVEWSTGLARLYYSTGPALVVAFLAIGQLYLLFPRLMKRFGAGATVLISVFWVSMVLNAPIDASHVGSEGWEAIERGPVMVTVTVAINAIGTSIIVGGTLWSVWRFLRRGDARDKAIGCSLIATGTIVVALGGTLTRFGHYEYLYIAMSVGVAMIYLGVLTSRSTQRVAVANASASLLDPAFETSVGSTVPTAAFGAPSLAFVQRLLASTDDEQNDRACTAWSVPRDPSPALSRLEARRAWRLRCLLAEDIAAQFDAATVPARRQLTTLYFEVLLPERTMGDDITELLPTDASARVRHA